MPKSIDMKHKSYIVLPGIFLLAVFLFQLSCVKNYREFDSKEEFGTHFSISEARSFYNQLYKQSTSKSTNLRQLNQNSKPIYPFWTKASGWTTPTGNSYIEVPTSFTEKETFRISASLTSDDGARLHEQSSKSGLQRMLFIKSKTGKLQQMLVNYIPDESYLLQNNFDISANRLNAIDKGYNGYIMYSDINRSENCILRIENGRATKMLLMNEKSNKFARKASGEDINAYASMECVEYCVEHWQQLCTINPDPLPGQPREECEDPILVGETCTIVCYYFDEVPPPIDPYEYPWSSGAYGGDGQYYDPEVPINYSGPKVNPTEENKCFNREQGAKLTIFVQQPIEGTRDKFGQNQVGHVFVGIEQNGITRYMGFYPNKPEASLLGPQASEIHDNSGELFHVSITKDISPEELNNVLNYINNYPKMYYLNGYNCANFGIEVAKKGNLVLPRTVGEASVGPFKFKGLNPGDLGEDIRNMTPPTGSTKNTKAGNGPRKAGSCN